MCVCVCIMNVVYVLPEQVVLVTEPGGGPGHLRDEARQVACGGAAQGGEPVVQLHQVSLGLQGVGLGAAQLRLQALPPASEGIPSG